ncbi:MAG TPA: hypothetical protein VK934_00905 [Fimbriimonas sp.]|nr:hypothetical protein [Fimbriimonas sp.]
MVTLTFATPMTDGRAVKAAFDRFAKCLNRQGVSFFWKLEFQESGRPHFHLLTTDKTPEHQILADAWAKASGSVALVKVQRIETYQGTMNYILKNVNVPPAFQNLGRLWGTRGPKAKTEVCLTAIGTPAQIAKLERPMSKIEKLRRAQAGLKPKKRKRHLSKAEKQRRTLAGLRLHKPSALAGKVMRDCGGDAIADALRRIQGQ